MTELTEVEQLRKTVERLQKTMCQARHGIVCLRAENRRLKAALLDSDKCRRALTWVLRENIILTDGVFFKRTTMRPATLPEDISGALGFAAREVDLEAEFVKG
jgi:hypothetical protein